MSAGLFTISLRGARWVRIATGIACAVALLVIAAHAGLIRAGQWQGDEYYNFGLYRDLGVRFLATRLFTYSPRPVSELLLYGYARAVLALHRPLIGPMLAVCWLGLFAALAGASRRRGPAGGGPMGALVLFAMFLLCPAVSEMFYWPMAAGAYLFCLGGIALAVLRLAEPGPLLRADRWVAAAAMLFGAWCAEVGCFFVACLCPLLIAIELRAAAPRRARITAAAVWLAPLGLSLPWLVLVEATRMHTAPQGWMLSPTLHQWRPSLEAAVLAFPAVFDPGPATLVCDLLFAAGIVVLLRDRSGRCPAARLLALAAALLATMLLSMIAAEYAYGSVCCERHATFRQCLVVLLLVVIAALAAGALPGGGRSGRTAGPLLLAAALAAGSVPRVAGLAADYRADAGVMRVTRATWAAGTAPGEAMVFAVRPQGAVVHRGLDPDPGTYLAGPDPPWFIEGILRFFGKQRLTVPPRVP